MESALLCSYNHDLSLDVLYLLQLNSVPVLAPFSFFFQVSSNLFYFSMNLAILHPNIVNSWLACSFSKMCPNFTHFAKTFQNSGSEATLLCSYTMRFIVFIVHMFHPPTETSAASISWLWAMLLWIEVCTHLTWSLHPYIQKQISGSKSILYIIWDRLLKRLLI